MITSIVRQSSATPLTDLYPIDSATPDTMQEYYLNLLAPQWNTVRASRAVIQQQEAGSTAHYIASRMLAVAEDVLDELFTHYTLMVQAERDRFNCEMDRQAKQHDELTGYIAGNYDHDDQAYW